MNEAFHKLPKEKQQNIYNAAMEVFGDTISDTHLSEITDFFRTVIFIPGKWKENPPQLRILRKNSPNGQQCSKNFVSGSGK